jgi:hypothetical protein
LFALVYQHLVPKPEASPLQNNDNVSQSSFSLVYPSESEKTNVRAETDTQILPIESFPGQMASIFDTLVHQPIVV